jgi:AcrR family transcriptional regulator
MDAVAATRSAGRREQILAAADRVVRRRGPLASMDEIAGEAGVTKPILYRHFGDKEQLYAALTLRYLGLLYTAAEDALAEPNPRRRIAAAVDAFLGAVEREPEAFRFVRHVTAGQPAAAEAAALFVAAHAARIASATRPDLERLRLDPDAAEPWAHGIVGMMQAVAAWWLDGAGVSRDRLVEQVSTLLWQGFGHLQPT